MSKSANKLRPEVPVLLNQTVEYALRAMACLAGADPDELTTAEDLAEQAAIPSHYVSKVMRQLVVAGLVRGKRGRGGGFRLARAPGDIAFVDVIKAVGGWPDPDHCAFGHTRCNPQAPCPLHPTWTHLNDMLEAWARTTTLADVDSIQAMPAE